MSQIVKNFIQKVTETYTSGHATEHSYRPALQELFEKITDLKVHNEPKRSAHGAPDFVFTKGKMVIAYAEAKDIDEPLKETEKGEQMKRYFGYSNIILTNGLEFRFYRNGESYSQPISIAKLKKDGTEIDESKFLLLEDTIRDFIKESKEPIKSGIHLAKVMAGKARRIRDNVKIFLAQENNPKNENLHAICGVIKKLLIHDLDNEKCADMYAQTLVYGLFVARYHDETNRTFSRQEARDLVPISNPFLRHFFDHIAGPSFDPRLEVIVNELCEEFTHADVKAIVHNYYKLDKDDSRDPIIHFYEDFLQEYDPDERKKMGVFYTPLPVVRFIVRATDDILKKEFNLPQGLADPSKINIVREIQGKRHKVPVHRVQVLDPATGTGTFLNETILHIKKSFTGQEGRWSNYVNENLLPRLHGFELMMASYTIAHLKLSSTIIETGAKIENTRLGVYLTNSLEKDEKEEPNLFSAFGLEKAIAEESNQANKIKNELPIMVVMGNPPYSGESSNNFEYANNLINKYKFEPGGVIKLKERNPKWLNDDYVKFIAFAEGLIEKNGEGVLSYITNHAYLDNPTFRGMRWKLATTFDEIYIVDLHGNAKKKEISPDGSKDENVFNIMQGVSIILGIKKKGSKKKVADVFHSDIYGKRSKKFEDLGGKIKYNKIDLDEKYYFFVPKNIEGKQEYEKGFSLNNLFIEFSVGIVTGRDAIAISDSRESLRKNIIKYIDKIGFEFDEEKVEKISYRPFDTRFIYYSKEVVGRGRWDLMKHFISIENTGLIFKRGSVEQKSAPVFISRYISESRSWSRPGMQGIESLAPLYLFHEDGSKVSNLKKEIVDGIEEIIGKTTPEDILHYIYAILHSPNYSDKYKEFLKIDFPRVPYPTDKKQFEKLVSLGRELRGLHLLESPKISEFITTYSNSGTDSIEQGYPKYIEYSAGSIKKPGAKINLSGSGAGDVFINEDQYFGKVPEIAWNFYIGGYQPAQKWLKDRKGRTLTNDEIEHYQKMIVALVETDRIMKEIDKIKL